MAKVVVTESSLENIGDAIRSKLGVQTQYKPSQMAGAISLIHGDPVLETLSATANGSYTPSSGKDGFSQVSVNVANSYTQSDEGKVVSSGALVAQTSQSITQNGTYDTTLNDEVVVNVSGGGGGSTTYMGTTDPSPSQGTLGDYYIKYFDFNGEIPTTTRSYTLKITKGLRGSATLTYVGAQEIQLIYDDGEGNEVNIITLANFTCSGNRNTPSAAFDGNTGGTYWEANPTPVIAYFSATVPQGYTLKKFVVWQRAQSYTQDVWSDFELIETIEGASRTLLNESGLTVSDWAGAGNGTEWSLLNVPGGISVSKTFAKVGASAQTAEWVEAPIEVTIVVE